MCRPASRASAILQGLPRMHSNHKRAWRARRRTRPARVTREPSSARLLLDHVDDFLILRIDQHDVVADLQEVVALQVRILARERVGNRLLGETGSAATRNLR